MWGSHGAPEGSPCPSLCPPPSHHCLPSPHPGSTSIHISLCPSAPGSLVPRTPRQGLEQKKKTKPAGVWLDNRRGDRHRCRTPASRPSGHGRTGHTLSKEQNSLPSAGRGRWAPHTLTLTAAPGPDGDAHRCAGLSRGLSLPVPGHRDAGHGSVRKWPLRLMIGTSVLPV